MVRPTIDEVSATGHGVYRSALLQANARVSLGSCPPTDKQLPALWGVRSARTERVRQSPSLKRGRLRDRKCRHKYSILRSNNFCKGRYIATLGTENADGTIHLMAVCYLFENGSLFVATSAKTQKARNISARSNASLMVEARKPGSERGVTAAGKRRRSTDLISADRLLKLVPDVVAATADRISLTGLRGRQA